MGIFILRFVVIAIIAASGYFFPPFHLKNYIGAGIALILGIVIVFLETRIRKSQFKIIWSSTLGTYAGVLLGWGLGSIYQTIYQEESTGSFIRIFFLVIMPYIGFLVGTRKFEWLYPAHLFEFFKEKRTGDAQKILDTSVIIDGRIADISNTSFTINRFICSLWRRLSF